MRERREPVPAMMVCGILFENREVCAGAVTELEKELGPVEIESREWRFVHTDYYRSEMGSALKRIFLTFSRRVPQDCLVAAKLACRRIEKKFMSGRHRTVNIDPGILTPERLVLATCKNFTHRIYIGQGVFAEITLIATRSGFSTLEWTFPDYASREILNFWNLTRKRYLETLKTEGFI